MLLPPKNFLYKRQGPWPQPSPQHPWGESPAVLHLPLRERIDWWLHIGSRYVLTMTKVPYYFIKGWLKPGLKKVDDHQFKHLFNHTMLAKFITNKIDDKDRAIFKDYMTEKKDWYIVDLEAVKVVKTFEGIYATGSKVLMYKEDEADCQYARDDVSHYVPKVIYLDKTKTCFEPKDGDAWELAKYFVLQGGALCATLVLHPLQHFPNDCINAITKTSLPMDHILYKLVQPHLRFTLALENAVLNFKSSLLNEKWWMPYAPYPGGPEGLRELLVEGYKGIKSNASYPPFSFPMGPPHIYTNYGTYLRAYYYVIYEFVNKILGNIEDDFWIKKWADYVKAHLRFFPSGDKIFEGTRLVRSVTSYLFTISVAHSVDHESYGSINKREVPLRLRQEPPSKGTKMKPRSELCNAVDLMKYYMADTLFFSPTTVTKLIDCQYNFTDPKHIEAVKVFKSELRRVDKEMTEQGINYMPLTDIAASIQF